MSNENSKTGFGALIMLVGVLCLALNLAWLLYVDSARPDLYQTCDFLTSFYTAGYAVMHGQTASIYPAATDTSYHLSAFDNLSHGLLPLVSANAVSNFQYTPLCALFFAPFGCLKPIEALIVWQAINLVALFCACFFLAQALGSRHALKIFLLSFSFFPVFHMLKVGQGGILFGVLPIALGLSLLARGGNFSAGLAFALCSFSPKFVPVVLLIAVSLMAMRNFRTVAGLVAGGVGLTAITLVLLPPDLWHSWAQSLHLAEQYYLLDPSITHRMYYYVSLPAILLQMAPVDHRMTAKLVIYGAAALLSLHALYFCVKVARSQASRELKTAMITIIALFLMPLVEPHLIFYDMTGFFIAIVLLWQDWWPESVRPKLRAFATCIVIVLDVDLLLFAFVNTQLVNPLFVVLVIGAFYLQFLLCCRQVLQESTP